MLLSETNAQDTIKAIYDEYSPTDKVQIRIPASNDSIDQLKITSAGDKEVQAKYDFYKAADSFIISLTLNNVTPENSDNQFIILAFKKGKFVGTKVIEIKYLVPTQSNNVVKNDETKDTKIKKPTEGKKDDDNPNDSESAEYKENRNIRLLVGLEQAGANSAQSETQPFIDLFVNVPLGKRNALPQASLFTNFRLASSPKQEVANLALPSSLGAFLPGGNQFNNVNNLVKSFQVKVGLERAFIYGENLTISGMFGVGATSSLSSQNSAQVFKIPRLANGEVTPEFKAAFPDITDFTGKQNIILVSGERDRFLRNWFVGARVKYNFFADTYPANLDLTFGQDEVITSKLKGIVFKMEGFMPIPVKKWKYVFIGASFNSRLTRRVNIFTPQLFLEPVANFNLFDNSNIIRNVSDTPFATSNRDNYSLRIGFDLAYFLNKKDNEDQKEDKDKPKK
jgi:hypothetical protein